MDRNLLTFAPLLIFICQLYRVDAAINYINSTCAVMFGNYTDDSVYQQNLDILLSNLSSQASTLAFHTSTAGAVPDKIYGLYQCRGDISLEICAECIQDATQKIVQGCPLVSEAAAWYDECMLRYANHSIFSVYEQYPSRHLWSLRNVSNYQKLAPVLVSTLHSVINDAAPLSPKGHFATKAANWTSLFDYVYCLAQCTPDLTENDCRRCLIAARTTMLNEYKTSTLVGIFLASCQLRYDTTHQFYHDDSSSTPPNPLPSDDTPPPPRLSPLPPPPTNTSVQGGETVDKSPTQSRLSTPIIAGIVVAGATTLGILLAAAIWLCLRQRKTDLPPTTIPIPSPRPPSHQPINDDPLGGVEFVQYEFATLRDATRNFSEFEKLGEGGFGVVYLGTLYNGQQVAIKRLSGNSGQGAKEFMTEVQYLARLQHKNLVKLLGFCSEGNEKLLVYEFLPNTSVDRFIFAPKNRGFLNWETRHKIIVGVARGIHYLHEDSRLTIIHRDLKLSNILLDTNMNPKIADFGMARLFDKKQLLANTTRIVGTRGYMAPEYILTGEYSDKSDVYSFGIIILELVSGQKNKMVYQSSQKDLLLQAWRLWEAGRSFEFIDPAMYSSGSQGEVMMRCTHIGLLCVQQYAVHRPTMKDVVVMLTGCVDLPRPTLPAMYPQQFNQPAWYDDDERESEQSATKSGAWRSDIEQDLYPR